MSKLSTVSASHLKFNLHLLSQQKEVHTTVMQLKGVQHTKHFYDGLHIGTTEVPKNNPNGIVRYLMDVSKVKQLLEAV